MYEFGRFWSILADLLAALCIFVLCKALVSIFNKVPTNYTIIRKTVPLK